MIKFTRPFYDKPIFLNPPFDAVYEGVVAPVGGANSRTTSSEATIIYINGKEFAVKESVEEVLEVLYLINNVQEPV